MYPEEMQNSAICLDSFFIFSPKTDKAMNTTISIQINTVYPYNSHANEEFKHNNKAISIQTYAIGCQTNNDINVFN